MTLAPVFRSGRLFEILEREGILENFQEPLARLFSGVEAVHADLPHIIDEDFLLEPAARGALGDANQGSEEFLRKYFFLVLFAAIFEHVGIDRRRLDFYAEISYSIMGTIAAADNLFDREAKMFLPLKPVEGGVFGSVLQLMCFERMIMRSAQRAITAGVLDGDRWSGAHKQLLTTMATIGRLEGSEESGTDEIMDPVDMVEKVHMVRGGLLFSLVTDTPKVIEDNSADLHLDEVEQAVIKLGTAFQLVDDITDFEFDLTRKSHNILSAEAYHNGTDEEKRKLAILLEGGTIDEPVEEAFVESAQRALETARRLTRESLAGLEKLGFWFPSSIADVVVQGIVADHGHARMEQISQ